MKKITILAVLLLAGCVVENRAVVPTPSVPVNTAVTLPAVTASKVILFAEDSAELTDTAKAQLTANATLLSGNTLSIRIEGHADETGSREYNLGMAAQRAASVRDFLVAKGIANARISIATLGNEQPAQSCDSAACHAQNRRVVIIAR